MTFAAAKTALAPVVDNGVNSTDSRIDARINEAQRRLIDHYNFLIRRENYEQTKLVYQEGGRVPTGSTTANLILDNFDATKAMVLALWREENNELEMALALEKKALDMIERDLIASVESTRREDYQALETTFAHNTLGGLTARIGLETLARYNLPQTRIQSYIRAAYRIAVDHYNFVVRREALEMPRIEDNSLPANGSIMMISAEIIREIVLQNMMQDQPTIQ
jgi:hypothetical protein